MDNVFEKRDDGFAWSNLRQKYGACHKYMDSQIKTFFYTNV